MQCKLAFGLAALVTLAVATPTPGGVGEPASSCSALSLLCCQATGYSTNPIIAQLLALLGISVPSNVLVGVTCSPIPLSSPTW